MIPIPPQVLAGIGIVVLLGITHGYAYMTGSKHKENEWKAKSVELVDKARETERIWQGVYDEASKSYVARIGVINDRLRVALDGLRDRPDRPVGVPEAPRPDCKGATGAELSRQDASFLEWEAARADRLRAAYELCLKSYDQVR
jgi:hypothetical protein